jgi:hypothetical protein
VLHLRTINQTTEPRGQTNLNGNVKVERQLVGLPWAADSCPWVLLAIYAHEPNSSKPRPTKLIHGELYQGVIRG